MKSLAFFCILVLLLSANAHAQFRRMSPADSLRVDSINKATQQDYKRMLQLLNISSTRRGPSGNPQAPDAANSDETKASPYTTLPDALVLQNGKKVSDANT